MDLEKILKYSVLAIVIGALATTTFWVLVGEGIGKIPKVAGDIYYGIFHKPLVIKIAGKTFSSPGFEFELPHGETGPASAEEPAGVTWPETPEGTTPSTTAPGGTTPSSDASPEEAAARAAKQRQLAELKGRLSGLQNTNNPIAIKQLAGLILEIDPNDQAALAALQAAEQEIVRQSMAKQKRDAALAEWAILKQKASENSLAKTGDASHASVWIQILRGRTFTLSQIEGLSPGLLKAWAGGGEKCKIILSPPSEISDQPAIVFYTDLQFLWDNGIGSPPGTLGRAGIPNFPATYSIP